MYNKINSEVFKPLPNDFKEKHGLSGKKMILGVASAWNERKGLYDYITLSGMLKSDYAIVLVGLAQKQIEEVHKKNQDIIALPKTGSAKELAEIYSAADVFVNLTYEDTFPTVNLEAEACGTPVITFDTGGCSETISGKDSIAVPQELHIVKEKIYSLLEG
jgi:glycosyltransferase involved in cell wall biosynthesis